MKIDHILDQKIQQYFDEHREEIIQQIFRLVRIKSVTQFSAPPRPTPTGMGAPRSWMKPSPWPGSWDL